MILPLRSSLIWAPFSGGAAGMTKILCCSPVSVATNAKSIQNSLYKFIVEAIFLAIGPVAKTPIKDISYQLSVCQVGNCLNSLVMEMVIIMNILVTCCSAYT